MHCLVVYNYPQCEAKKKSQHRRLCQFMRSFKHFVNCSNNQFVWNFMQAQFTGGYKSWTPSSGPLLDPFLDPLQDLSEYKINSKQRLKKIFDINNMIFINNRFLYFIGVVGPSCEVVLRAIGQAGHYTLYQIKRTISAMSGQGIFSVRPDSAYLAFLLLLLLSPLSPCKMK